MRNGNRGERNRSSNQSRSNQDRGANRRSEQGNSGSYSREWYDDDSTYDQGNYGRGGYGSYDDNRGYGSGSYERNSWRDSGRGYGNDPESYASSYGREEYDRFPESNYRRGTYGDSYDTTSFGVSRNEGSYSDYGNGRGQNSGNWGFGRSWNRNEDAFGNFSDNSDMRNRSGLRWGDNSSESHRGKGPKGYQRSDERIQEDVNDRLSDDEQLDASEIEVKVEQGEVTLTGSVSERNAKRRAEDLVESVSGVKNVENRIRINERNTSSKNEKSGNSITTKSNDRSKMRESLA